jgi:O-antigen ligase
MVGILNGNDNGLMIEDIKPLLFFFMLIYFELTITNIEQVRMVARVTKISAVMLALSYIVAIFVFYTGNVTFESVYLVLGTKSDFIFRGQVALFYKGFVYICIGIIFFIQRWSPLNVISTILCLTAIILTMTKGLILATLLIVVLYIFFIDKRRILLPPAIIISMAVLIVTFLWFEAQLGDKSISDQIRITTMNQVISRMDVTTLFIGHGFGQGVPERPVHMEISFLEIFHKQGLVGVLFWLSLITCIIYYYCQIKIGVTRRIALPFLLGSIFLYLESVTNPFINNPIGMSFLLISLVSIRCLSKNALNRSYQTKRQFSTHDH